MTDKCCCLHIHMAKVFEWHGYLEIFCLNLQDKWKNISIYLCYHTKERDLALRESYTMSIQSLPYFENLETLQTSRRKTCIDFYDEF